MIGANMRPTQPTLRYAPNPTGIGDGAGASENDGERTSMRGGEGDGRGWMAGGGDPKGGAGY